MGEFDFKPNSHKSREEQAKAPEKKIEKIVSGNVRTRKKSGVHNLADIFVPGDVNNVKSYIFMDVLVPAIKDAVADIVTNGISMILYGESASVRKKRSGASSYISYDRFSSKRDRDRDDRRSEDRGYNRGYMFEDIILDTRGEAEEVLSKMDDIMDNYDGIVTVGDLHDLVGITGQYTDQKYGWTNLRNAKVVRVRDGYMLDLPKALPIK